MVDVGLSHAVFQGLVTGSYVALGAIGLGLVYNIGQVPNFAHGELLMVGAYFALLVNLPWELPVFRLLASEGSIGLTMLAILFVITVVSTIGIFYLLGGMRALKGSWWPIDVPEWLGLTTHIGFALLVGLFIVFGAPGIFAGLVLATVLLAAIAPLFDRFLFKHFREGGAELVTMLIVTMGLAFAIRFSMQAWVTGVHRSYTFPRQVEIVGNTVNLFHFKEFDFFFTNTGIVLRVLDTFPTPNAVIGVFQYSWVTVAVILIVTAAGAYGGYRWRGGGRDTYRTAQTLNPLLVGGFAGVGLFALLAVVLAQSGTNPDGYFYATRIRNSYFRLGMIVIAVVLMLGLHVLLKETKLGKAMRASADNLDLAKITGIDTGRVMMTTWIIAGAFAAIAGVFVGMLFHSIRPTMGFFLLLPLFAAVILGGLRSIYGAIIGAYAVGISMEVGLLTFGLSGVHRPTIAFIVLLLVLLVRPEGIIGGQ